MVGDDIETDVLAAQRQGLTWVLVKTGKYLPSAHHGATGTPDHVLDSFADLRPCSSTCPDRRHCNVRDGTSRNNAVMPNTGRPDRYGPISEFERDGNARPAQGWGSSSPVSREGTRPSDG